MNEITAKLLRYQKNYIVLKGQSDTFLDSLNAMFERIDNAPDIINKLKFGKVQRIKNEIDFIFSGIKIFILTKFNSEKGTINWGVKISDEKEEKRIVILQENFDKHGNVIDKNNYSDCSVSSYYENFEFNLLEVVNKYFNDYKEVDFYYEW